MEVIFKPTVYYNQLHSSP